MHIETFDAVVRRAEGRPADALAAAERAFAFRDELSIVETGVKLSLIEAVEAALALRDLDKAG